MIKVNLKRDPYRRTNDYRTSRFFARMLSIFGWVFMIVWLLVGLRYGVPLGQELHGLVEKFVWEGVPVLLINLFLVMWLLALVMFGFVFVVAGQGMRAVFEMANSSKHLVRMAEQELASRRKEAETPGLEDESVADEIEEKPATKEQDGEKPAIEEQASEEPAIEEQVSEKPTNDEPTTG